MIVANEIFNFFKMESKEYIPQLWFRKERIHSLKAWAWLALVAVCSMLPAFLLYGLFPITLGKVDYLVYNGEKRGSETAKTQTENCPIY